MARIMAIDYGERRVGIALSDALKITVRPYETLVIKKRDQLLDAIKAIVEDQEAERVIVGLPLTLGGSVSRSTRASKQFAEELRWKLSVPVDLWDERLSTYEAERILIEECKVKRKKLKKVKDAVAACVILRSYLNSIHD